MEKDFLAHTKSARDAIALRLAELIPDEPKTLYEPIRYATGSGGKYLRSLLAFLTSRNNPNANWLPAACAVELLHLFTLVHDDIMDNADTRRGKPSLHKEFGTS